jgi:hypothetical protein
LRFLGHLEVALSEGVGQLLRGCVLGVGLHGAQRFPHFLEGVEIRSIAPLLDGVGEAVDFLGRLMPDVFRSADLPAGLFVQFPKGVLEFLQRGRGLGQSSHFIQAPIDRLSGLFHSDRLALLFLRYFGFQPPGRDQEHRHRQSGGDSRPGQHARGDQADMPSRRNV